VRAWRSAPWATHPLPDRTDEPLRPARRPREHGVADLGRACANWRSEVPDIGACGGLIFVSRLSGLADLRLELCVRRGPRLGRLIRCPTGRITDPTGWRPSDTKKLARAAGLARRDSPAPKVRATGSLEPRALNARARRTHVPSHARAGQPRSGDFCVRGGPRVRANQQGSAPQATTARSWCERIGSDGANRFACRCSTSAGTGCWTAVHEQPGLVDRPKRAGLEPA
jgi:hypothetical protein